MEGIRGRGNLAPADTTVVIPAQAVIQYGWAVRLVLRPIVAGYWIPACAGLTATGEREKTAQRPPYRFNSLSIRGSGISHISATSA
jgi:hypothetical protein